MSSSNLFDISKEVKIGEEWNNDDYNVSKTKN